ncbi:hypothetical protein GCM10023187_03090 [Nibrella viscosa]|uniref:Uncharacterized protein n=1 Tax=Nibrella viscosa TaxID=1084524 RepID=A0ABP8JTC7_9BACT
MATVRREVMSYKVGSAIRRVVTPEGTVTHIERTIQLNTASGYHNLTITALLAFSSAFDNFKTPVVGYFEGRTVARERITIWLPLSEFDFYYSILRHEKPVYFEFEFAPTGEMESYGHRFTLTSESKPTREEPQENTAISQLAIPERNTIQTFFAGNRISQWHTEAN